MLNKNITQNIQIFFSKQEISIISNFCAQVKVYIITAWSTITQRFNYQFTFYSALFISTFDVPFRYQFGFQDPATVNAENIYDFHNDALVGLVFICNFVLAMLILVWKHFRVLTPVSFSSFLTRVSTDTSHDLNSDDTSVVKASYPLSIRHDPVIETWWTALPSFFLIFLAVPSFSTLYMLDELENPQITIRVTGVQWYWRFEFFDFNTKTHPMDKYSTGEAFDSNLYNKLFYYYYNPSTYYQDIIVAPEQVLDFYDLVNSVNFSTDIDNNSMLFLSGEEYLNFVVRDIDLNLSEKTLFLNDYNSYNNLSGNLVNDGASPRLGYRNLNLGQFLSDWTSAKNNETLEMGFSGYFAFLKQSSINNFLSFCADSSSWFSDKIASKDNYNSSLNVIPFTKMFRLNQDSKWLEVTFESHLVQENDLVAGSFRNLEVDERLVLPFKTEIRLLITSMDVLHSFAVPSLGLKLDACPGRLNETGLFARRQGTFYGQCSEICGVYHGFMPVVLEMTDLGDFWGWHLGMLIDQHKEASMPVFWKNPAYKEMARKFCAQ